MEIPFQGEFDESMLRRMTLTALRPARGRLIGLLLFAGMCLWGLVIFPLLHGESLDLSTYIPVLVVACLFLYLTFVWGPKKQLQSNKLAQGPRAGTVGEEGIHIETPYSKADFPWDVFTRAKLAKDVVLLYNSSVGSIAHPFPREFFASERDWNAFVELVRQRVQLKVAAKGLRGRPWLVFLIWIVVFILIVFGYNVYHATGR